MQKLHIGDVCYLLSICVASVLSGCVADFDASDSLQDEEVVAEAIDELNGYGTWAWGTTNDLTGINLGATSAQTCVLAGVAGNLKAGGGWWSTDVSARAYTGPRSGNDSNWLVAHGGGYANNVNVTEWLNTPVQARATCFYATTNVYRNTWRSREARYGIGSPVKLANLDPNNRRYCFLNGIRGNDAAWASPNATARIVRRSVPDSEHPTAGWYVEGLDIYSPSNGLSASIDGVCVDFPQGTVFSYANANPGTTTITSGSGIKGCGLQAIKGAFNVNSWTNGALIQAPAQADGNWTITVSAGKLATWGCAK